MTCLWLRLSADMPTEYSDHNPQRVNAMATTHPTKSVRITHGKVDELRKSLHHCPVKNLAADASERALIDAALDITTGLLSFGLDLPRVHRSMPRFKGPNAKADTVVHVPDELIYLKGEGLMVLTGMQRVEDTDA